VTFAIRSNANTITSVGISNVNFYLHIREHLNNISLFFSDTLFKQLLKTLLNCLFKRFHFTVFQSKYKNDNSGGNFRFWRCTNANYSHSNYSILYTNMNTRIRATIQPNMNTRNIPDVNYIYFIFIKYLLLPSTPDIRLTCDHFMG